MIWRYGILKDGRDGDSKMCDLTDLDQWISERTMKDEMPKAPLALKEAIEKFLIDKA